MRSLTTAAAITACSLATSTGAAALRVPRTQQTAQLERNEIARSAPSTTATRVAKLAARRPITSVRTVVPVLAKQTSDDGRRWLEVRLPGRPNGLTGWILASGARLGRTPWHIVVSRAARRARVYRYGKRVRTYAVIVGRRSTPTPLGEFFVEENIAEPPSEPGAPYALALSARSNVLQEFDGGPGQIALHGVAHLAGQLGTAVSHGCVRFSRAAITWLAARIPPGVPVSIVQ